MLNASAYASVDQDGSEPKLAPAVNGAAPRAFAEALQQREFFLGLLPFFSSSVSFLSSFSRISLAGSRRQLSICNVAFHLLLAAHDYRSSAVRTARTGRATPQEPYGLYGLGDRSASEDNPHPSAAQATQNLGRAMQISHELSTSRYPHPWVVATATD